MSSRKRSEPNHFCALTPTERWCLSFHVYRRDGASDTPKRVSEVPRPLPVYSVLSKSNLKSVSRYNLSLCANALNDSHKAAVDMIIFLNISQVRAHKSVKNSEKFSNNDYFCGKIKKIITSVIPKERSDCGNLPYCS